MKTLNLTVLENKVVQSLISLLQAEAGFSDVDCKDVSDDIRVSIKSVRGALGSLVKKNVVIVDENDGGFEIIYLQEQFYGLHPRWSKEFESEKVYIVLNNQKMEKKVIPGFSRYSMDKDGRVFNNSTDVKMSTSTRKVNEEEVVVVRLNSDDGKRVFVETAKIHNSLFQQDIEGKTQKEGIKKQLKPRLVTKEIATAIRKEKKEGARNVDLAKKFGIHNSTVSNIIHNRKYLFND